MLTEGKYRPSYTPKTDYPDIYIYMASKVGDCSPDLLGSARGIDNPSTLQGATKNPQAKRLLKFSTMESKSMAECAIIWVRINDIDKKIVAWTSDG